MISDDSGDFGNNNLDDKINNFAVSDSDWKKIISSFNTAESAQGLMRSGFALLNREVLKSEGVESRDYAISLFQSSVQKDDSTYASFKNSLSAYERRWFFSKYFLRDYFMSSAFMSDFEVENIQLGGFTHFNVSLDNYFLRFSILDDFDYLISLQRTQKGEPDFYCMLRGNNSGNRSIQTLGFALIKKDLQENRFVKISDLERYFNRYLGDEFPCPVYLQGGGFNFFPAETFIDNSFVFLAKTRDCASYSTKLKRKVKNKFKSVFDLTNKFKNFFKI